MPTQYVSGHELEHGHNKVSAAPPERVLRVGAALPDKSRHKSRWFTEAAWVDQRISVERNNDVGISDANICFGHS
jgi:hypothetical protein